MTRKMLIAVLAAALSFGLGGCGGGGSSSSDSSSSSSALFELEVVDGGVRGADVFADKNGNKLLDEDEKALSAKTGVGGKATLPEAAKDYPIVAIIGPEAIDEDNLPESEREKPTEEIDAAVKEGASFGKEVTFSAPAGKKVVTPITTMVQSKVESGQSLDAAEDEVLAALVPAELRDYITPYDDFTKPGDIVSQVPEAVKGKVEQELAEMHQVAQVITQVLGDLQASVEAQVKDTAADAVAEADATTQAHAEEQAEAAIEENKEAIVEEILAVVAQEFGTIVSTVQESAAADATPETLAGAVVEAVVKAPAVPDAPLTETISALTDDVVGDLDPDGDGQTYAEAAAEAEAVAQAEAQAAADVNGDGTLSDQELADMEAALDALLDSDGDGVPDTEDLFPINPNEAYDTDGDRVGDNADNCPGISNVAQANLDFNLEIENNWEVLGDACDDDIDGDLALNLDDAFPFDAAASLDTDGDGATDAWNEGKTFSRYGLKLDAFPEDASASADADGDGYPEAWNDGADTSTTTLALDVFPGNPDEWVDADGDGHGDNLADAFPGDATEWTDSDGDLVGDNGDAFPTDAAASADSDGDGYPESWNDGADTSTTSLALDAFPDNGDEWVDADADGYGDNLADAFPGNGDEWVDADGDGFGDNLADAFPGDATEWLDSDGDLVGDNSDPDPNDPDVYSELTANLQAGLASIDAFELSDLNGDLLEAANSFAAAEAAAVGEVSPEADLSRFFYALTRVAKVAFDTQTDGNPGDLNGMADLLDRFNVPADYATRSTFETIDLPEDPDSCEPVLNWDGSPQLDLDGNPVLDCDLLPLPGNAPTSGEMLGFVESQLGGSTGALADAAAALSLISPEFQHVWTETYEEWDEMAGGYVTLEEFTDIDYSDVLFLKGLAQGLQAQINIAGAYDLNVDIDAIDAAVRAADAEVEACELANGPDFDCSDLEYNPVTLLASNPNLLRVQAAAKLASARGQLQGGLSDIQAAIVAVQSELDDQADDFVTFYDEYCYWDDFAGFEVCEPLSQEDIDLEIAETLADLDEALALVTADGPMVIVTQEDDLMTEEVDETETLTVDPSAFFGGLVDFQALLPVDLQTEDFTPFPDTTLGGVLPAEFNGVDPLELNADLDEDGLPDLIDGFSQFSEAMLAGKVLQGGGSIPPDYLIGFELFLGGPEGGFTLDWWSCPSMAMPCEGGTEDGTWAVVNGQLVLTNTGEVPAFFQTMTLTLDEGEGGEDWLDLSYNWHVADEGFMAMDGYGYLSTDVYLPPPGDSDGDGLTDEEESSLYGTDPYTFDTDGDMLNDGMEVWNIGTDPLLADSDEDGLFDGEEVEMHATHPLVFDTDGDGLSDGAEVLDHGTDPNSNDSDMDGLFDWDEIDLGTEPWVQDTDNDTYMDGEDPAPLDPSIPGMGPL